MQRVRIGLSGLAFVFLAVLLAAIFTGQSRNEAPITPNSVAPQGPGIAAQPAPPQAQAPPEEPLATLGLTPSNTSAAPPPAAAPPAGRR
jgi:hypothetical protein